MFNVDASADSGFNLHRHLLMNNYDIGGGRHDGAKNNVTAVKDIFANNIWKATYLKTYKNQLLQMIHQPKIHKDKGW